jgi:hypothetical protein
VERSSCTKALREARKATKSIKVWLKTIVVAVVTKEKALAASRHID